MKVILAIILVWYFYQDLKIHKNFSFSELIEYKKQLYLKACRSHTYWADRVGAKKVNIAYWCAYALSVLIKVAVLSLCILGLESL